MNLDERLDALMEAISRPTFMENRGLGNEIGYYIFDYPAPQEMLVREWVEITVQRASQGLLPFRICHIDIFQCVLEIMKEKGFYGKLIEMDGEKGGESLIEPIRRTLRLNDKQNNLLIKKMEEALKPGKILFLTGAGKVFPAIRSHGLLNEMHARITQNPVLLFFPGDYRDRHFTLFGKVTSDDYYRGFKIVP